MTPWPEDAATVEAVQTELARAADEVDPWIPPDHSRVGATFIASRDTTLHAAAVCYEGGERAAWAVIETESDHPYMPGMLALREGPAHAMALLALEVTPDVVLVNATGRDHPRGAGLALHLGALVGLPTVGVTDRPLVATGPAPGPRRGDTAPLVLDGRVVGVRLRACAATRALCVHAAWRTSPEVAVEVLRSHLRRARTPRPLREARRLARTARSRSGA